MVAHNTTNLTDGTGGPQDASVLYTAEDVLADLAGLPVAVDRAERVGRVVSTGSHRRRPSTAGRPRATAYDCLVRVRRTG